MATGEEWTASQTEMLTTMVAEGTSATAISKAVEEIGPKHSRNAVIGKAYRLGLIFPVTAQRNREQAARDRSLELRRQHYLEREAKKLKPPPIVEEPLNISLLELDLHGCKWPSGEKEAFRFCGRKRLQRMVNGAVVEGPYCERHHARAYAPRNGGIRHASEPIRLGG